MRIYKPTRRAADGQSLPYDNLYAPVPAGPACERLGGHGQVIAGLQAKPGGFLGGDCGLHLARLNIGNKLGVAGGEYPQGVIVHGRGVLFGHGLGPHVTQPVGQMFCQRVASGQPTPGQ